MPVSSTQRFTKESPCPICDGYDRVPRGQNTRCYGYLSADRKWAHCTRSEKAGKLQVNASSDTYAHKLSGTCGCGERHNQGTEDERSEITASYDYKDINGQLKYQVVRYETPTGAKQFKQRRPNPANPSGWIWDLRGVSRILYRLPELIGADPSDVVFVVEGEKDADNLVSMGAVATTNSGGALKWNKDYSTYFKDRIVVIIPDNDPASDAELSESLKGQKHAALVARSVYPYAKSVQVLEIPHLPLKGDVSDWLYGGGTMDELLELVDETPYHTDSNPYRPGWDSAGGLGVESINEQRDLQDLADSEELYDGATIRPLSQKLIHRGLLIHGELVKNAGSDELFYFDRDGTRQAIPIDVGDFDLQMLLSNRYKLNATERLFNFLVSDLKAEAHAYGKEATVGSFFQYQPKTNVLYMDMRKGNVLRLDGVAIDVVDNGTDDVLFKNTDQMPWQFIPGTPSTVLTKALVEPINFTTSDDSPHTPDEQRLLFLIWLLTIPFGSVMPTKPLALAIGERGAGKSYMFRVIGKILYGDQFNVDSVSNDEEKDFWVNVTNSPFVVIDNADYRIKWLEQALLKVATGARITKRILYTTNMTGNFAVTAFVALTARTPKFRAIDLSERLLIFNLDRIENFESEAKLTSRIMLGRDGILSAYAALLNKMVAVTDPALIDTTVRMADFAAIASRAAVALKRVDATKAVLEKLKRSQMVFTTEESPVIALLDQWLDKQAPKNEGEMMGIDPGWNDGREVQTGVLFNELRSLADQLGARIPFATPISLGIHLQEMIEHLGMYFKVESGRDKKKRTWMFSRLDSDQLNDTV